MIPTHNNFVFFWRTHDIYSQWHKSYFSTKNHEPIPIDLSNEDDYFSYIETIEPDHVFANTEQWMMFWKAILFRDYDIAGQILEETSGTKIKKLGRKIKNFNNNVWDKNKYNIVKTGNRLKFSQNPKLRRQLLNTGNKTIVEASPYDCIWGVGMKSDHPDITDPTKWKGQNLLGKAIMEVRDEMIIS
jgi:ribA/ribD-fused uncharacterized protein